MALPRDVPDPYAILVPKGEQKLEITFPAYQSHEGCWRCWAQEMPGEWHSDWQGAVRAASIQMRGNHIRETQAGVSHSDTDFFSLREESG